MSEHKWKRFEKLAYEIQKGFVDDDALVTMNDSIIGVDSGVPRQIDISIRRQLGQLSILAVIECKDHKDPIDVKEMEAWAGEVRDVRANKGAIISSSGFTPAALRVAKNHGIDTYRLIDTESIDWKSYVSVPVLLRRTFISGLSIHMRNFLNTMPVAAGNFHVSREYQIFSQSGEPLGTMRSILAEKWNNDEIPKEPGTHLLLIGERVLWEVEGENVLIDLALNLRVQQQFYLGQVPVNLRGLQDLQYEPKGNELRIITKQITTDFIEPYRIEQGMTEGWEKIENIDELAIEPFIQMHYDDWLTKDKEEEALQTANAEEHEGAQ